MRIRSLQKGSQTEEPVESLNISLRGAYFATKTKFELKEDLELRLHMPEQLMPGQMTDWRFTGRVTHVQPMGKNGLYGVGVQFLYYSVADERKK